VTVSRFFQGLIGLIERGGINPHDIERLSTILVRVVVDLAHLRKPHVAVFLQRRTSLRAELAADRHRHADGVPAALRVEQPAFFPVTARVARDDFLQSVSGLSGFVRGVARPPDALVERRSSALREHRYDPETARIDDIGCEKIHLRRERAVTHRPLLPVVHEPPVRALADVRMRLAVRTAPDDPLPVAAVFEHVIVAAKSRRVEARLVPPRAARAICIHTELDLPGEERGPGVLKRDQAHWSFLWCARQAQRAQGVAGCRQQRADQCAGKALALHHESPSSTPALSSSRA
jgi:hypothetical protein